MLPKQNRLLTRYQFNKVRSFGQKHTSATFHIYYLDVSAHVPNSPTQVGFVISNKFSKSAAKRNRVKRVFREVIRTNFAKIKQGYWIVIYPKVLSLNKGYEEINTDFNKALQNLPISS